MIRSLLAGLILGGCSPPCRSVWFEPVSEAGAPEAFQLHGCLRTPAGARGAVVLVHGLGRSGADWEPIARELTAKGYATLTIDLRGHGQSGGQFPVDDPGRYGIAANDVRGALRWFRRNHGQDSVPMVLVGASLGGGAVLANAMEQPTTHFVAWYPGLTYQWHGDSLVNHAVPGLRGLVVHGAADSHPRASAALSRRWLARNPGVGVIWIPGGQHGTGPDRSRYHRVTIDSVSRWLAR